VNQDFLDLLSAFNAAEVRYLVVGAYAVGVHGHPRATKDLDVWIETSPEVGNPPRRIDVLTQIDGVRFNEVAPRAVEASFDGVPTQVIGLEDLLTNKRAAGRLQDLADVRALERLRSLTAR
jgi:hypothetical protein